MSKLRLHSIINCTLPTPAVAIGEGRGIIDLAVRFLLIEHPSKGVIMIDGGYGPEIHDLRGFKASAYRTALKVPKAFVTPEMALQKIGRTLSDISTVILSHMHADHVGNLSSIPLGATLLASPQSIDMIKDLSRGKKPALFTGNFPELIPVNRRQNVRPIGDMGLQTYKFADGETVRTWDVLGDQSVYAIPLPGHASDHLGFIFPNVDGFSGPLIYGVDAAWTFEGLTQKGEPLAGRLCGHDENHSRLTRSWLTERQKAGVPVFLCHDDRIQKIDINLGPQQ